MSSSDPLILAFDTSAAHCAAALLSGDQVLAQAYEEMAKGQGERLMGLLQGLLSQAGAGFGDLNLIAVGTGPGNFTGIRLSVAAARGLALSTGARALGVSRLEAAAHGLPRPVCACFDARREAVYLQLFNAQGASAPQFLPRADLPAQNIPAGAQWVGDLAEELAPDFAGLPVAAPMPLAVAIGQIACARKDQPAPRPAPLYLRPADAAPAAPAPQILA
ncbi:MAG: tRNA (adenosine(37)-N6)-threonylcarbamoyltransferase complex dimerization subunit type 1 TsaB [Mangrovicoccus sp.]|nr:tRNA (adenosine(37)-N6)-threonylcarbamoyltransferase complex dimerization subunit type 1 TsaB [Mangrovicoccus sp.]